MDNILKKLSGAILRMGFLLGLMVVASFVVLAVPAFAGADATFSPLVTLLTNYMQGSLGTLLALVAGAIGLGSAMAGRWAGMFTGFGVAAAGYYIPSIIPTITTGLM